MSKTLTGKQATASILGPHLHHITTRPAARWSPSRRLIGRLLGRRIGANRVASCGTTVARGQRLVVGQRILQLGQAPVLLVGNAGADEHVDHEAATVDRRDRRGMSVGRNKVLDQRHERVTAAIAREVVDGVVPVRNAHPALSQVGDGLAGGSIARAALASDPHTFGKIFREEEQGNTQRHQDDDEDAKQDDVQTQCALELAAATHAAQQARHNDQDAHNR